MKWTPKVKVKEHFVDKRILDQDEINEAHIADPKATKLVMNQETCDKFSESLRPMERIGKSQKKATLIAYRTDMGKLDIVIDESVESWKLIGCEIK